VEQLVAAQLPQDEDAVLLNFPPLEKAKADIIRLTFLLLHFGHTIFSEELKISFSNSCSHWLQWYSKMGISGTPFPRTNSTNNTNDNEWYK
jgi:hypothetical protein